MRLRCLATLCLVPACALSACGSKTKDVNTASYTCGQFQKSLNTKGDNSAGNYINQLIKQAKLHQTGKNARNEMTAGIFFTCRNQSASTKPAKGAISVAKRIEAGTFKLPGAAKTKKKSGK